MWRLLVVSLLSGAAVVFPTRAVVGQVERHVVPSSAIAEATPLFVPQGLLEAECGSTDHASLENYIRMVRHPELVRDRFAGGRVPDCFPQPNTYAEQPPPDRRLEAFLEHQPAVMVGEVTKVVPGWSPLLSTVMERLEVRVGEMLKGPAASVPAQISILRLGGRLQHGGVDLCFEGVTPQVWEPGDQLLIVATGVGALITEKYEIPASDGVFLYLLPVSNNVIDLSDYPGLTSAFATVDEIRREVALRRAKEELW